MATVKRLHFKYDKPASEKSRQYAEDLLAEVRASAHKAEHPNLVAVLEAMSLPDDLTQWEASSLIDILKSARSRDYDLLWTPSSLTRLVGRLTSAITRRQEGGKFTDSDTTLAMLALQDAVDRVLELTA